MDGDGDPRESPWHFGKSSEYPALSYRGADPVLQRGDYDTDDNGLIEVRTLAQLNAIRWDLNGDGAAFSLNAGPYRNAFRNHATDMGCPTSTDDADDNDCAGYELGNDLDFDTDGDGSTHTGGAGDSGDAFHNGGAGWRPIGSQGAPYTATFDGNGRRVSNLFISRSQHYAGLFGNASAAAEIRSLGIANGHVAARNYAGLLVGENAGRIAAVWTSGFGARRLARRRPGGWRDGVFGDRGELLDGIGGVYRFDLRRRRRRLGGGQRGNHRRQLRDRRGDRRLPEQAWTGRRRRHGRGKLLGREPERHRRRFGR